MNTFENSEQNGSPSENPLDVKKELRGLLMKFHPDRVGQSQKKAEELSKILTELFEAAKEGRAVRTWSDLNTESTSHYKEGDTVHFVRQDDEGNVHEAEFRLPKWVRSFRQGLAAFSEGKSDEEVREVLEFDPLIVDRKAQREAKSLIDGARTIDELIRTQEKIRQSKSLLETSQRKLLREIAGKIAGAYSPLLQNATKLSELTSLSRDVQDLIRNASEAAQEDKDYFLNILSMIVDARAEAAGSILLEDKEDTEELEKIASYITAINAFPFNDPHKKEDLIRNGNKAAHAVFMEAMKKTRSEKGLEQLHEYVFRFPFSPDANGEDVRNETLTWIEKKWLSYFSPEARDAQKNLTS